MPHTFTVAAQHVQIGAAARLARLWAGGKEESRWRGGSGGSSYTKPLSG